MNQTRYEIDEIKARNTIVFGCNSIQRMLGNATWTVFMNEKLFSCVQEKFNVVTSSTFIGYEITHFEGETPDLVIRLFPVVTEDNFALYVDINEDEKHGRLFICEKNILLIKGESTYTIQAYLDLLVSIHEYILTFI